MKSGVSLTAINGNQETVLHTVAKLGHSEIVYPLLQNSSRGVKVDAEAVCHDGLTVLHYAAQEGHGDAVVVLLNAGADKAARDGKGRTARDHAVEEGPEDAKQALEQESQDQTTLQRAAAEG